MVVDQDQLNPHEAYEGDAVRVPHNPLMRQSEKSAILDDHQIPLRSIRRKNDLNLIISIVSNSTYLDLT